MNSLKPVVVVFIRMRIDKFPYFLIGKIFAIGVGSKKEFLMTTNGCYIKKLLSIEEHLYS